MLSVSRTTNLAVLATAALLTTADWAAAHCQVPCGIYGDQRRFEELLEDTETITKAIGEIGNLSGTHDATGHNQLARWVATKEDHASNIQHIIGQYFLAQRIKADAANYVDQLKAAHGVIVAAMKCKQAADPATAAALKESIHNLYRAYTGKEPQVRATANANGLFVSLQGERADHAHGHDDHHAHREHAHDGHGHDGHGHEHDDGEHGEDGHHAE